MRVLCLVAAWISALLAAASASGQVRIPLPNAEGWHATYQSDISDHDDEAIDPYLGGLGLRHVDVQVPGNGGFDLKLIRAYSSARVAREGQAENDPYTPKPLGWTMHFGRLLVRYSPCIGSTNDMNTMPVLEMPDGTRRLVWRTMQSGMPSLMTTDRWKVACVSGGYSVTSPDGVTYEMKHLTATGFTSCPDVLHPDQQCQLTMYSTTRMVDRHGNQATISYQNYVNPLARGLAAWSEPKVMSLSTGDGRSLAFSYAVFGTTEETKRPYLTSVDAGGGRLVRYGYTNLGSLNGNDAQALTSVDTPMGRWEYSYYVPRAMTDWRCTVQISCPPEPGDFRLKTIKLPAGGVRTYTWTGTQPLHSQQPVESTPVAVQSKLTSDGGSWTFSYVFDSGARVWTTTIHGPSGSQVFRHRREVMESNKLGVNPPPWTSGLLLSHDWPGLQQIAQEWKGQPISDAWGSLLAIDSVPPASAVRPVLIRKTILRGGASHVSSFGDFDSLGSPRSVTETGPGGGGRAKTLSYVNDTSIWFVAQPKDESWPGASTLRSFDARGNLVSQSVDGVVTSATYDAQGNVITRTYPRGLVHQFGNYKRGIAQSEAQPEGILLSRVVDNLGNITSETNGDLRTATFGYDAAGRTTSIAYPRGLPLSVAYTPNSRTSTRGGVIETVVYDAFNRPQSRTFGGVTTTFSHDALNRQTFESVPGGGSGTRYEYDALGRLKKLTHADGSSQTHSYGAGTKTVVDERGLSTTTSFRSYGDPEQQVVMAVSYPVPAANIAIARNARDLTTSVTQSGWTRTYGYNANYRLISTTHPETGTTTYGRDAAGNMTSRTVGASLPSTFSYDGQNRQTSATHPGLGTLTQAYSKTHKLLSVTSPSASRSFGYDENNNLRTETLQIDGLSATVSHAFDGNDRRDSTTYPSANVVSYAPDAFGRPTQASGAATAVSYWPSGQLRQITYANGAVTTYGQNARLWPSSFATQRGGSLYVDSRYGYDGAGNLLSVSDAVDASFNRSLGYDGINRLTVANGPWGSGAVAYDGAGNITSQVFGNWGLSYAYANNRLSSVSGSRSGTLAYDAYGNVISAGASTYTYDGAPNLRCAQCANAASKVEYAYDGLGRRVLSIRAGIKTYEMSGRDGNLLLEYTPSQGNRLVEYIYLGDKRIAQRVTP